jgi:protein-tyrosine phosphatase
MEREAIDRPENERAALERAAAVLAAGGLVALPTETVYALAARADDPTALARLAAAQTGSTPGALTWHVPTAAALERFPRVSPLAVRLAARYWPGPLTLVLPGVPPGLELAARSGWLAVRAPAHRFVQSLLSELEFPLAVTGALGEAGAPSGAPDELAPRAVEHIDLLVDAGRTRLREPSAVLRLGQGNFELLRPGLFTREELAAAAGLRIAFVCTGNTCRSPMAEALARALLAERLSTAPDRLADFGFELASMGLHAGIGDPASREAIALLAERGLDLARHRARRATLEAVLKQDRVYCMTRSHREALLALLPPMRAGHVELLDPRGADVPDPIGGTRGDYLAAAARIETAILARLEEWA